MLWKLLIAPSIKSQLPYTGNTVQCTALAQPATSLPFLTPLLCLGVLKWVSKTRLSRMPLKSSLLSVCTRLQSDIYFIEFIQPLFNSLPLCIPSLLSLCLGPYSHKPTTLATTKYRQSSVYYPRIMNTRFVHTVKRSLLRGPYVRISKFTKANVGPPK